MKVICFRGGGGTGKSSIIKRILDETYNIKINKKGDVSLSFVQDNLKIGICSYGDTEKCLEKYLKPLKDENCDIILCACHKKGKTKTYEFIIKEFDDSTKFIECIRIKGDENIEDYIKEKIFEFKKLIKAISLST